VAFFGPGEAGYVKTLAAFDKAFGQFFARLAKDGITKESTLFIITADENDHFVGGPPSPADCDGITTPCTYAKKGEINNTLDSVIATEFGNTTPFAIHFDSAPTFYINGNPGQTDPSIFDSDAWNHGDFQNQITKTWLGAVGPGVLNLGRFGEIFSDHTDIRPTILRLAGLKGDYAHDGRVLFEGLDDEAIPDSLRDHRDTFSALAEAYKQINAPRGALGTCTLIGISTTAVEGDDATYASLEARLDAITERRDQIAGEMIEMLEAAAFESPNRSRSGSPSHPMRPMIFSIRFRDFPLLRGPSVREGGGRPARRPTNP
jgi:hypothetical protein